MNGAFHNSRNNGDAEESGNAKNLIVLGIDPGLASTGWGVIIWDLAKGKAALDRYGVIETPANTPMAQRLDMIFSAMSAVIETHHPTVAVVEELFFSKNVKTAMSVAQGRAASILATARRELTLHEFTPNQIKQALTGSGRADKRQVQLMVRAMLNLEDIPRPDHAADALAAALGYCHGLNITEKREAAAGAVNDQYEAVGNDDIAARKALLGMSRRGRRR